VQVPPLGEGDPEGVEGVKIPDCIFSGMLTLPTASGPPRPRRGTNALESEPRTKKRTSEYKQGFGNEVHRNRCGIHADTKCRVNTRINN